MIASGHTKYCCINKESLNRSKTTVFKLSTLGFKTTDFGQKVLLMQERQLLFSMPWCIFCTNGCRRELSSFLSVNALSLGISG
jgi:hypothetical protein